MTPYDRLLAEEWPTPLAPPPPPGPRPPWTPAEQKQHRTTLREALHNWHWQDDTSLSSRRRHHRLVRRGEAQPHPTAA